MSTASNCILNFLRNNPFVRQCRISASTAVLFSLPLNESRIPLMACFFDRSDKLLKLPRIGYPWIFFPVLSGSSSMNPIGLRLSELLFNKLAHQQFPSLPRTIYNHPVSGQGFAFHGFLEKTKRSAGAQKKPQGQYPVDDKDPF